jgi:hypothetical protein
MANNVASNEKAKSIVNNCTPSNFNRAVEIKELLAYLGYDETASEMKCKEIHGKAVDIIKKNLREIDLDIIFDDKNKRYTSLKKQIDEQTKAGRLQCNNPRSSE